MMEPIIKEINAKSVITKTDIPVCDYDVNPYVGCTHGCKYCYASFMKRFTNHPEEWGTFLDVKYWPEITDVPAIIDRVKDKCNLVWLENLNLRGSYKSVIMDYIREKYPELTALYEEIYLHGSRMYWMALDQELQAYADENGLEYVRDDDSMKRPFEAPPVIVNYFYHEEVKKSAKIVVIV